jgi:hypothetical protein
MLRTLEGRLPVHILIIITVLVLLGVMVQAVRHRLTHPR